MSKDQTASQRRQARPRKPDWRAPRLVELGNVHEWVLEGGAQGKYGFNLDGGTSGNNEAMDMN